MLTVSTRGVNTLRDSHQITVYCAVFAATGGFVGNLPVSSGTVRVNSSSQVRRTATVGIASSDLWPTDAFSLLSPIGSEMVISYGVVLQDGRTEYIQLIRGPITSVGRTTPVSGGNEGVAVEVADRSQKIAEARLDAPAQTVPGATTVAEITRLITAVLPDVSVKDLTGSTKVAPQIEIERERWSDGVEKLADSIGAEVWADTNGNFVIRPEPTVDDAPVWIVDAGDGGILVSESDTFSRDLTYNRVVASGQRTDGTPPVYGVVSDTNPTSPTYIGGPFGIKTRFYASQLLTTVAQCEAAATSLLARVTGHHKDVTFTTITNPALEAGDVIQLLFEGRNELHIVDSVDIPLTPGDLQSIKTRTLILPEETLA